MRIYLVVALLLGGCGKVNTVTSGDASCGDTTDNPANCGTCGHACGSNQTCSASECVDACEAPMSTCGSDCIDLQTDAMHCGNCTTVCGSMEDCKAGTCQKIRSYTLTGAPDPSTVFNTIAETYNLPNNLVGAIWHRLANVILVGDFNSYAQEDPIASMTSNGYVDEIGRFNSFGYSYGFDGSSGRLDHALTSPALSAKVKRASEWHINADEPAILDYNLEFKQPACATCSPDYYTPTPYRASDHDPVVIGLSLGQAPPPLPPKGGR